MGVHCDTVAAIKKFRSLGAELFDDNNAKRITKITAGGTEKLPPRRYTDQTEFAFGKDATLLHIG
ncbi:Hypothetical protein CINCED_3A023746, partial [Cinara cedri]